MTRVQELQEIECLAAANLTEYDPVWSMAEGRFQEITNAHSRQTVLGLPGFKADKVRPGPSEFRTCPQSEEFARRAGMNFPRIFKSVVFPVPVPPAMRMFFRPRT